MRTHTGDQYRTCREVSIVLVATHSEHQAFVKLLVGEGILDAVKVLDYHAQPVTVRLFALPFPTRSVWFRELP